MSEVVEMIINPRLSSNDLLKRFVSMDRMLENVTTYYFENFLNINSRSFISYELQTVQTNVSNTFIIFLEIRSHFCKISWAHKIFRKWTTFCRFCKLFRPRNLHKAFEGPWSESYLPHIPWLFGQSSRKNSATLR